MSKFIIPFLLISLLIYSKYKKINAYKTFISGAQKSLFLIKDIFPYIFTIMIAICLFRTSGLMNIISNSLKPIFKFLGMPIEVCELVILKPFSGSGSLALLENIMSTYGPDSYISRCACAILGSSETVFYVSSVYFSKTTIKNVGIAIPIGIFVTIISSILACLFCKIM